MIQKFKKITALVLSTILILGVSAIVAVQSSARQSIVPVTREAQAVDTIELAGKKVNAYYGFSGKYHCAELVMRFYSSVFGVRVNNLYSPYSTPTASKGAFRAVKNPRVGDIVRFSDRTHWALVKSVGKNSVTIIEQNWSYYSGGSKVCAVGRTISKNAHTFFHYTGYDKVIQKIAKKAISARLTEIEDNKKLQELEKNAEFEQNAMPSISFAEDKFLREILES